MAKKRCFGNPPPGLELEELGGLLVVVEGPDASGRSTHIHLLSTWLEQSGYPVARTGLTRSQLVSEELDQAKLGNVLSPRTMSLFYAADFYDQLENVIAPALRAGAIVLADRYIFTLKARDRVRGADPGVMIRSSMKTRRAVREGVPGPDR
jgi:dTMP kinase